MEVIEIRIPYKSRKDEFKLFPLGDVHLGTKHCNEKKIEALIKEIEKDKFALWIGMGDYAELITPRDPRWDVDVIADWVEQNNIGESQRKRVVKLFKPIADKCVGMLEGNHEASIRLHNHQDIYLDICRDLGVTPLGYTAFVKFLFTRARTNGVTSFVGVFRHGKGSPQTEGGKIMNLKQFMDSFDADIYCEGHLHCIKTNSIPQLGISDSLKIVDKVKVGAISGSWFMTYQQGVRASYAERAGYNPSILGCPIFTIVPDKGLLRVTE